MKLNEIKCKNCGYHSEFLLGSTEPSETLSDLNEDVADYHLYQCDEKGEYHSLNKMDPDFDGKCPIHGAELKEVKSNQVTCPICGEMVHIHEKEINIEKKEDKD
jgi:transcription initiation factor IIE alpha subunit